MRLLSIVLMLVLYALTTLIVGIVRYPARVLPYWRQLNETLHQAQWPWLLVEDPALALPYLAGGAALVPLLLCGLVLASGRKQRKLRREADRRNDDYDALYGKYEALIEEVENARHGRQEVGRERDELQERLDSFAEPRLMEERLNVATASNEKLQGEVDRLTRQVSELSARERSLSISEAALKERLSVYEDDDEDDEEDEESVKSDDSASIIANLHKRLEDLIAAKATLEAAVHQDKEYQEEIDGLRDSLRQAREEAKKFEVQNAQVSLLQRQNDTLQKEVQRLETELKAAQATVLARSVEHADMKGRYEGLGLDKLKRELDNRTTELQKAEQGLEQRQRDFKKQNEQLAALEQRTKDQLMALDTRDKQLAQVIAAAEGSRSELAAAMQRAKERDEQLNKREAAIVEREQHLNTGIGTLVAGLQRGHNGNGSAHQPAEATSSVA